MKYTDLTKAQQDAFNKILDIYGGGVPDMATHFDMNDLSDSGFVILRESGASFVAWPDMSYSPYSPESEDFDGLLPIPDKPWYDPKDVALTPKPKIRKIVYDRDAFNTTINWIVSNSPYAQEDWRNKLPLDVRRWMKDLIKRYDAGEIDGVSYISSAGLTLMSSWESDDVLHFDLFADVNVGADCGEYEYDVEDVF